MSQSDAEKFIEDFSIEEDAEAYRLVLGEWGSPDRFMLLDGTRVKIECAHGEARR